MAEEDKKSDEEIIEELARELRDFYWKKVGQTFRTWESLPLRGKQNWVLVAQHTRTLMQSVANLDGD